MPKIMIIAGEPSGDLHGGRLVDELKRLRPDLEIYGIGGDRMQEAGMDLVFHVRDFSFMGFAEVLGHLPFIRQAMRRLERLLAERRPEAVVLIDYPGFNLRFGAKAKRAGIKVVYFISPQVWAWGRGRVRRIRRMVDRMLCILPFEEDFYRKRRVPAVYVGNPLVDLAKPNLTKDAFRRQLGLSASQPLVGLLPGSRSQEVEKILPPMLGACRLLSEKQPSVQFAVNLAPGFPPEPVAAMIKSTGLNVAMSAGQSYELMAHSDLVLAASGTATLECGIIGTPLIIIYKTSWISYLLGRMLVKVPYIGLVNLVAGKKVAPEFIQHEARPGAIFLMAQMLLAEGRPRQAVKEELSKIPGLLGEPGAARRAAGEILGLLADADSR
jgi:lipid-A-disaccharide synthase